MTTAPAEVTALEHTRLQENNLLNLRDSKTLNGFSQAYTKRLRQGRQTTGRIWPIRALDPACRIATRMALWALRCSWEWLAPLPCGP